MQATDKGSKRLARLEGIIQALSSEQDREDASAGLERLKGQLSDLQQTGAGLQAQARRLPLILNPCMVLVGQCEHSKAVSGANCFHYVAQVEHAEGSGANCCFYVAQVENAEGRAAANLWEAVQQQQQRLTQWEQKLAVQLEKIVSIQRGLL